MKKREITSHKVNGLNDTLDLFAVGDPGPGGANHIYDVRPNRGNATGLRIEFHTGPFSETTPPAGLSNEVLLAILIDRMSGFQSGEFACDENELALNNLIAAKDILHKRTRDRLARGVEGTHEK